MSKKIAAAMTHSGHFAIRCCRRAPVRLRALRRKSALPVSQNDRLATGSADGNVSPQATSVSRDHISLSDRFASRTLEGWP